MQITRIGDFEVQRLVEFEGPFIAPEVFFPDYASLLKYCRKRFKNWDKRFKKAT